MDVKLKARRIVGLVCAVVAGVAATSWGRVPRKYVAFAWENGGATPSQMLKRVDDLDKTAIDGVGVYLSSRRSGGELLSSRTILVDPAWSFDDFAAQIPLFRKLSEHPSMKESFVTSFRSPPPVAKVSIRILREPVEGSVTMYLL